MIGAAALLALSLQLAAAPAGPRPPNTVVIRNASKATTVDLVDSPTGPMLRLNGLNPIVTTEITRMTDASYRAVIAGVLFEIQPGSTVVRVGDETRQLAAAPALRDGQLMVPVQLVSEVIPTFVPNTHWDAADTALVIFSMIQRPGAAAEAAAQAAAARSSGDSVGFRPRTQQMPTTLPANLPAHPSGTRSLRRVIVDAGHGGPDNGMTGPMGGRGPKLFEKDITLAVSKRLGTELRSRGVEVVYTRTTDTLIALSDRGHIANRADGDLFISIHVNAPSMSWKEPASARGFETYFLAEAKTEDARRVERMENESVQFETDLGRVAKNDPLSFIYNDMAQNEHLRESSELAEFVQRRLALMHPGPNRGVKQAGFRVLVTAYMPAVLVEIGFGSNPREAEFLLSPEKQQAIASAVADAALDYLQRYERRVAGPAQ